MTPGGKPLSVLHVEDSEDDAALARLALRRGGYDAEVRRVEDAAALESALAERRWDVVLSDYSLPGFTGLEALTITRRLGPHQPFLIVSGAIGEETAVELMRGGANDYIMKDKLARLVPAIERVLGEARMRREREEALESLRRELRINAALAELAKRLISSSDELEVVAPLFLEKARELTGSTHGYVAVFDRGDGNLEPLAVTAMRGNACAGSRGAEMACFRRRPDGGYAGLCGHSLNNRQPFFENAPARHPAAAGTPAGHAAVERFLSVPVLHDGQIAAQIALANPARDYAEPDLAVVERLADLFLLAILRRRATEENEALSSQLRQAQKMEAIGTLAGGIAHDFNNILTPIIGYTEMVQMALPAGEKAAQRLEEVLKACSRAKDLVQQILTFSRQAEQAFQPLQVQTILKEALKLLRSTIPATIEIRQEIDPGCGAILADPTQVHQVVMNLCTNAFQAMRERGGVLAVSLGTARFSPANHPPGVAPGSYVRLEVRDTGVGIDPKTMARIFDPYFTTKKKGEGTGLGLSVVQGIVTACGGHIAVESEPGAGTRFQVLFPVAKSLPGAFETGPPEPGGPTGRERILVVDDEPTITELAREILESLGYSVTTCTNSLDACERVRADPAAFDLVVTDMTMPLMTGPELLVKLRALRPGLPVVLCTGYSESVNEERARELGFGGYFAKPINVAAFARIVRSVLDQARPAGEAGARR